MSKKKGMLISDTPAWQALKDHVAEIDKTCVRARA